MEIIWVEFDPRNRFGIFVVEEGSVRYLLYDGWHFHSQELGEIILGAALSRTLYIPSATGLWNLPLYVDPKIAKSTEGLIHKSGLLEKMNECDARRLSSMGIGMFGDAS